MKVCRNVSEQNQSNMDVSAVEAILRQHRDVLDVAVRSTSDEVVAYVVPAPSSQTADAAHTAKWKKLSEFSYSHLKDAPTEKEPGGGEFNFAGWKSSYTDQPLVQEEMSEWVDETVNRILSFRPRRVLEIGCGTGLLLFRIARTCEKYWATDISQSVTQYVQRHVAANPQLAPYVKVWRAEANELGGDLPAGEFDVVVLNSVLQYFPGLAYLTQVIEQAKRILRPGGVVFVGDVRNLETLQAFHLTVLLHNLPADQTLAKLRSDLRHRIESEPELAVSPAFFATLPGLSADVEPRRGKFHNEMTQFRYNAILRLDERLTAPPSEFEDWAAGDWSIERIRSERPVNLALRNIPDARSIEAIHALAALQQVPDTMTVGEFRKALPRATSAVDPQDLWPLESELGVEVKLGCDTPGTFAALIGSPTKSIPIPPANGPLANDPGKNRRMQALVSQLVRLLRTELPAHLASTRVVAVDSIDGI